MPAFRLHAAQRDYVNCPVTATVDPAKMPPEPLVAVDETGVTVPAQRLDASTVALVVPCLRRGETRTWQLRTAGEPAPGVALCPAETEVEVHVHGKLFTVYRHAPALARPVLHPLIGPSGWVTRGYPLDTQPGETQDHPHHKSCWVSHGDINGVDHWSEQAGHGRQVQQQMAPLVSGPVLGDLAMTNHWCTADGVKQLEEDRHYRFWAVPGDLRLFDLTVTFRATEGPIRFGDTKEGGICAIRVATSMDAKGDGTFITSYGAEKEVEGWGKRAHWCSYTGPVGGETAGVAIFDHPANFRHPTYWHVRNYGLMTANPFGLSHFYNDKSRDGGLDLAAGASLTFRYRVVVHRGTTAEADIATLYHHYLNPPAPTD